MNWITITDGRITVTVPYQSYLDLFRRNGFSEVIEEVKSNDDRRTITNKQRKVSTKKEIPVSK